MFVALLYPAVMALGIDATQVYWDEPQKGERSHGGRCYGVVPIVLSMC